MIVPRKSPILREPIFIFWKKCIAPRSRKKGHEYTV